MSRPFRGQEGQPDGKARTMRGLDRHPPRPFRKELNRQERHQIAIMLRNLDTDAAEELPTFGQLRRPHYT